MRGSRIEGSTVVAEMVLSVNLMSPTIEQVVSKMKRSHLTLLDLLIERLASANAPKATRQVMRLATALPDTTIAHLLPSLHSLSPSLSIFLSTHPTFDRSHAPTAPNSLPAALDCSPTVGGPLPPLLFPAPLVKQELIERREQQTQRKAEDFNSPDAYQAATNAALVAQRRALGMLATAQVSWRIPLTASLSLTAFV
jgi:hypothetical protein